jgi:hypothetical protein
VQFGPADALSSKKTHRFNPGKPVRPAHVHQHAVHIKYEDFRKRNLFRTAHSRIGAENFPLGNVRKRLPLVFFAASVLFTASGSANTSSAASSQQE